MKARIIFVPLALMGLICVGNAYAMTNTQAMQLAIPAYKGNTEALAKLKAAADSGDPLAEKLVFGYFMMNNNNPKELLRAAKRMLSCGTGKAEVHLGLGYLNGAKNYTQAIYWFKKAVARGGINEQGAETGLGYSYLEKDLRRYSAPDYEHAIYWFKKAVARGGSAEAEAEVGLGNTYTGGRGKYGMHFYSKAAYWYKKAAMQGDTLAEYTVGNLYYNGRGVPRDKMTAIMWWKKAAAQGGENGKLAQHKLNIVDREVNSESGHHLSLIDLVNGSPYANKGKKYHIYFSKVVQLISEHNDLLDYKGNYYIAKFKGYAPQRGNFITGYCSGLGAIRYQSADNRLEIVPHVFFYRFNAYSLDNLKYAAMAENLEMRQMMAIGLQAFGGKTG